jgi:hypothetical protein
MTIDSDLPGPGGEPYKSAPEPPKQGHGCFFYGCITASVLAVLVLIAIGITTYFGLRYINRLVTQYTSPTPMELPKVEMSDEDRMAVRARFDAFKKALDQGDDTDPLVLTGDELNVLLAQQAKIADKVYFIIEGDKLKGEVSLPLGALPLPGAKGRYFNGKATFLASLHDGKLDVRVDSAEVNGQPVSEQIMTGLRNANMAEDTTNDPDTEKLLGKLESIDIKDGTITIKARPKDERGKDQTKKATEKDKEEAKPEEPTTEPPKKPAEPAPAEEKAKEAPAEKPQEKEKESPAAAPKEEKPQAAWGAGLNQRSAA